MKQARFLHSLGAARALTAFMFCCLNGEASEDSELSRPDLTGVVRQEDGKPLKGASVFIYTAGPKEGVGILCPSCYADCRKRSTTDSEGRFKIEDLDPNLLFRVLVVAKDHRPEFVSRIDPAVKPVEVTLKRGKESLKPDQQMTARIIDHEGKPVSGAVVSIRGVSRGQSTRFGGNEDIDQVAVSDDDGLAIISGETSFDAVGVEVEARAWAKAIFERLSTGGKVHELKLTEGASVQGRLMQGQQPVVGVEIGICGADRSAESYVGDFSVGTDKDGKFFFVNLPPKRDYFVYARMNSASNKGALPARRVRVDEDGSLLELGDIELVAGLALEGQIRLTDGKPVPPKTRVLLSREEAWDSTQAETDDQGRFKFVGVPSESIGLSVRVKGYRLSSRNRSLDTMNPFHLVGRLRANKTDLIMEFEPGENEPGGRGDYVDLRQEPLLGAEAIKDKPKGDTHVLIEVFDAETRTPVDSFTVTEGFSAEFPPSAQWFNTRQTEGEKGKAEVFLNKGRGTPLVMVEANGYLPQASAPITVAETNIVFSLKKGTGPSGVVVKTDGKPADGVTVFLPDLRNGVYVQDKQMKVREGMYQGTRSTKTDEEGKFTFRAKVDDSAILILDEDGFAQVSVEELSRNPEVKLQAWAKVIGKLIIGPLVGAKEDVHLWPAHLPYEFHPRHFPPLSMYLNTETDENGEFVFERVPPINVQVYHSPKVREGRTGSIPMSQTISFALKPGELKSVIVGGQGRPVIGQMVVNGYEGQIDWRADVYALELILPPTEELPDLLAISREQGARIQQADSDEEKNRLLEEMRKVHEDSIAKQRAFYRTERGRDYYFQNRRYALNFAQDGTFRVEDVPGGKYRLRVDLREGGDDGPTRFSAPLIASLQKEIEVPDSPGGRAYEPFDLGKIEMQARIVLSVGKAAPDFEAKTVDDQVLKLSNYAGKYVLLDFWAVWCGPCVAEMPHLKETYRAFKSDPRFEMIGLSLDSNSKTPRDYAKKNQIGWTMGFLGEWSKTDLPARYGVEGIPSIFLIGPDGKIIAKDLRGENIKATVERILAQAQGASTK